MDEIELSIFNIVGNSYCVDTADGQKVFEMIGKALKQQIKVRLSFRNVDLVTSAFLNTAIGQLYGIFQEDVIKQSISVVDMLPEDKMLLKRVTSTAKLYYKNPELMEQSIKEILGED